MKVKEHERTSNPRRARLSLDPVLVDDKIEHHYPDRRVCACCGVSLQDAA